MRYLSPDVPWPKHPGKDADKALRQARALGWSFREEAHFGRIRCPHEEHNGGCELGIWGTSKDKSGSMTARKIWQKLRACERLGGADPTAVVEAASIAVGQIETLVGAAERLRESDVLRDEAETALDSPNIEQTDDQAIEQALQLDEDARDAEREAWLAAIEADAADRWPPKERARGLAVIAAERLSELASTVDLENADAELVGRMEDLRSRLTNFGV